MVDAQRPWKGPILDNHFHLNRNGRFLDAAKDFKNVGGTHLVLVHCPDFSSPPTSLSEHRETYADTIAMANEVRKEHDLHVRVVLGPPRSLRSSIHQVDGARRGQRNRASL